MVSAVGCLVIGTPESKQQVGSNSVRIAQADEHQLSTTDQDMSAGCSIFGTPGSKSRSILHYDSIYVLWPYSVRISLAHDA